MNEMVLGVGHGLNLIEIAGLIAEEMGRNQGPPKTIHAKGDGLAFMAKRPDFDAPFTKFVQRFHFDDAWANKIKEVLAKHKGLGELRREEDEAILTCVSADSDALNTLLGELGEIVTLPGVWRAYGEDFRVDKINVEMLFQAFHQYRASDIHLSPGQTPLFRIDGQMRHSELVGKVSAQQIQALLYEIAPKEDIAEFEAMRQASFCYHQKGLGYSRVSAFIKNEAPHMTFRFLPESIPSFEDLAIPRDTMESLAKLHHGLVLVTGMTGSGKSTTVASLIDWINSNKAVHILTIENPVEYVHKNKTALISQRNLGRDVDSFHTAVTGALRHDPDVIMIGEMRDPDTIRSAINAAATGHLVISTLHANTAYEVINRVISFFDPVERDLVRLQLRDAIKCIICQRLLPKKGGGRIPALEVMFNDIKPINDGIKNGDTETIQIGMQQTVGSSFLFEKYLFKMYKEGKVDLEVATLFSTEASILQQMIMGTYSVPRLEGLRGH